MSNIAYHRARKLLEQLQPFSDSLSSTHLVNAAQSNNTSANSNDHSNPSSNLSSHVHHRAVLVTGTRTPFIKSFTDFTNVDSIALSVSAVGGLIRRTSLPPSLIDQLILGNVVVNSSSPNIARETILDLNLPKTIPGLTISIACLSGLEAISLAVQQIETGHGRCIIAGGSDSTSNAEMPLPRQLTSALGIYQMGGGNKKGWTGYIDLLKTAGSPFSWFPSAPSISERSTGKVMGYHADLMAQINHITRAEQDQLSLESHMKAATARKQGKFNDEIVPVKTKEGKIIKQDNLIRDKMDNSKLSQLPPAFRPAPLGTITAASSSALTDGAAVVLVMEESLAKQHGYPTDITLLSYVKCAFDPMPQLLLAPALAIPMALEKAGLKLDDIDLIEIHEAFAGQVLATLAVLADPTFYEKHMNKKEAVGIVDRKKLNVNGGSLAMGHPFAATGGRIVINAIDELRRTGKKYALISICAAGGIGGVAILQHTASKPAATATYTKTIGEAGDKE